MKRCPKGTRKNKDGQCVSVENKTMKVSRKNELSTLIKDSSTTKQKCPNGTRKDEKVKCVSK